MTVELTDIDREDTALVIMVVKGDRDAFASLVGRFQGRIYNFIFQFFRNPDLAAELTQETFLRVFRFIDKFDTKRKFSTWIFSIAKNICIDEHRKIGRRQVVSLDDVPQQIASDHSDSLYHKDPSFMSMRQEERMLLEEAIALLPEKYRAAIILCYFQEMTYQEIAEILGLNLNLVKVRIFRAKKMLLEILRKDDHPKAQGVDIK